MKKLLLALAIVGLVSGNVFAGCRSGGCAATTEEAPCEPAPICEYQVTKTKPARKHCKKECWYTCPAECVRKEAPALVY